MPQPIVQGVYFVAHASTALVTVVLGYWTLTRSTMRARRWFSAWLFDLTLWSTAAAASVLITTESLQLAIYVLRSVFGVTAIPLALSFAAVYTGRRLRGNPVAVAAWLVYATVLLLAVTAPLHDLYWQSITPYIEPFPHLDHEPGPGWVLLVLFSISGTAMLLYYFVDLYQRSRHQVSLALLSIGGGLVVALVPLVLSQFGIVLISTYDHSPFGISIVALTIGYAVLRQGLYDIEPIARDEVVDDLDDPFFTVDDRGRLVDYNPAGRKLVGDLSAADIGRPITELFPQLPIQLEEFPDDWQTEAQLVLSNNGHSRYFDVNTAEIDGPRGEIQGGLVVLREITLLKEREHQLDLLRQLQSRVLRHNIRNDLNVITAYTQLLAEDATDEQSEMADIVLSTADDLVALSDKARVVEQLIEGDNTAATIDLTHALDRVVGRTEAAFPAVSFSLDAPATCQVTTTQPLEIAFENLIENAAEHNDATEPTVDVTLTDGNPVVVTITDNGPGIPESELRALDHNKETQLQHGSGIGLWAVDWIIDQSSASIDYETGPAGTMVSVRIPREQPDQG